ncbi:FG-GAP-like repeat-containing protein [Lentisphaerota bacterium ZTH]|nr:VCBS repeat-containing protein [Lentisphaerota bacterium]WET06925.1 FG-GAP-like repeat-containing protein [Lentisphaerota bacterium ZTH]
MKSKYKVLAIVGLLAVCFLIYVLYVGGIRLFNWFNCPDKPVNHLMQNSDAAREKALEREYDKAVDLYQRGLLKQAEKKLIPIVRKLRSQRPLNTYNSGLACYYLWKCNKTEKQAKEAKKYLTEAMSLKAVLRLCETKDPSLFFMQGDLSFYLGDYKACIIYYNNFLQVIERLGHKVHMAEVFRNMSIAYHKENNYTKALLYIKYAKSEYPAGTNLCQQANLAGLSLFHILFLYKNNKKEEAQSELKKLKIQLSELPQDDGAVIRIQKQFWKTYRGPIPYGFSDIPKSVWVSENMARIRNRTIKAVPERLKRLRQPEALVAFAQRIGLNTINFPIYINGVMPLSIKGTSFNNMVHREIPEDYYARLVEACEANDIGLWATIGFNGTLYLKKHPGQSSITLRGEKGNPCPRKGKAFYKNITDTVAEVLEKYPYISGIVLDEPFVSMNCEVCREAYRKKYGKKVDLNDPDYTEFRENSHIELIIKPLIDAVKKVNPYCQFLLAMPRSRACVQNQAVNITKYADAGFNVWCPEFGTNAHLFLGRNARRQLNIEKFEIKNTPQFFNFKRLFYVEKGRNTESMYRDIYYKGRGLKLSLFKGASLLFCMEDDSKVKWPGIVEAHEGRTLYFAFSPFASPKAVAELKLLFKKLMTIQKDLDCAGNQTLTMKTGYPVIASPCIENIDGKPGREVVAVSSNNEIFVCNYRGNLLKGWPVRLEGFSYGSSPAAADVDGDGKGEIAVGSSSFLYLLTPEGKNSPGWPVNLKSVIHSAPTMINIDGKPGKEILVGTVDGNIHILNSRGKYLKGWPRKLNSGITASLTVHDLDSNGSADIIAATEDGCIHVLDLQGRELAGWPQQLDTYFHSSPVLGDIDRDGSLDIIIGGGSGRVYVLNGKGEALKGWPQRTARAIIATPSLGDVDSDGKLEIAVASTDSKVYIWKADGQLMKGWPASTGMAIEGSPVIADINGDSKPEVIVGSWDKRLYCWNAEGKSLKGWPLNINYYLLGTPAIGDINNDGRLELVIADDNGDVSIKTLPASKAPFNIEWAMFKNNPAHTGVYVK